MHKSHVTCHVSITQQSGGKSRCPAFSHSFSDKTLPNGLAALPDIRADVYSWLKHQVLETRVDARLLASVAIRIAKIETSKRDKDRERDIF